MTSLETVTPIYDQWGQQAPAKVLLSPVLSFTSEPTPSSLKPLVFLIPFYSCSDSYLLFPFVLFPFIPVHLFCPTLSYYHAIDNHVVLFSSSSCIMCWLNLMFLDPSSPELRYLFLLRLLISEHILYLNCVSPSIQGNLVIAFNSSCGVYLFPLLILFLHLVLSLLLAFYFISLVLIPTHLYPISVRLQPLTSAPKL